MRYNKDVFFCHCFNYFKKVVKPSEEELSNHKNYLNKNLNLDLDERSNFKAEHNIHKTSHPKVFAAGDCRRGQSLVVWAINEGRAAAREIDQELMGQTSLE